MFEKYPNVHKRSKYIKYQELNAAFLQTNLDINEKIAIKS
jgi:hypothetical protein